MRRRSLGIIVTFCLLSLALGCTDEPGAGQSSPPLSTLMPTAQPTAAPPLPNSGPSTASAVDLSVWQTGDPGLELRRITASVPSDGSVAPLLIVRLDLSQVQLRVGYAPGQPRALREWRDERDALVVVNGGFFTPEYSALGLTISEGRPEGSSREFGGMFAIDAASTPGIRDLAQQPYSEGEALAEAVQSFPLLVRPGGEVARIEENGERARRTAIAIDTSGRVLLIVAPTGAWTLQDLAAALVASDLAIDSALNLDGGSSTGMIVRSGPLDEQIIPFTPLPQVLIVTR